MDSPELEGMSVVMSMLLKISCNVDANQESLGGEMAQKGPPEQLRQPPEQLIRPLMDVKLRQPAQGED